MILIVEDEKDLRESCTEILEIIGYEVISATNGAEGLEMAKRFNPQLILSDINMPIMDGFQMTAELKTDVSTMTIPIVFLTAKTSFQDIKMAMNHGVNDYIVKPFEVDHLAETVSRQLAKSAMAACQRPEQLIGSNAAAFEEKTKKHLDSLKAAHQIQKDMIPSDDYLRSVIGDHFRLWAPKEIVSGDVYWARQIGDITLVAVMDCTGHGVPGAMLTMLCQSQLNTVVDQFNLTDPAEILNTVNDLVIKFLDRNGNDTFGMDISLCAIHKKENRIVYAGANRPLFVCRRNVSIQEINNPFCQITLTGDFGYLIEVRGDRKGIGSNYGVHDFTNKEIEIAEGDMIYMSSDGYMDQFGGADGKKFLVTRFRKLLYSLHLMTTTEQRELLVSTLAIWKQDNDQTDDILILGIRM